METLSPAASRARAELELRRRRGVHPAGLSEDWREWVPDTFPDYTEAGFGPHHDVHWDWVWALERGVRPPALVNAWARGGAKSTSAEMACVAVGASAARGYGLYVCSTQDQADDHVQNIGDMLVAPEVARAHPLLARRKVSKYGTSAGWKRNRLRTAAGFTIDAVGLDKGFRGLKLEEHRPDFMIFDDIDEESDTLATTEKKIRSITRKAIPAGASDLAVLFIQNIVIPDGVVAQLVDGRAKFLEGRIVNGPVPAIWDLDYEELESGRIRITGGTPSWDGQDKEACEQMASDMGLEAFLAECQHEVDRPAGNLVYRRSRVDAALERGEAVEPLPGAEQILAIDPGFAVRAAMLAIQETGGDRAEMWKEWSFHRCDDDHIAGVAAEHILEWGVSWVYYDAEAPELAKAMKKKVARLCRDRGVKTRVRFQKVAFGEWKRLSIKTTRWLLQQPNTVAWKAETTELHVPHGAEDYRVTEEPSVFRREVRNYALQPGKDEPIKEDDHGPDAWSAYAVRWVRRWLKAAKKEKKSGESTADKDWIPEEL